MINRDEFLTELKEEQRLRKVLRRLLEKFLKEKDNKEKLQEKRLRSVIRQMIAEAAKTDVPDAQPHSSTGINILEELLRNIIPTIEEGYKALTSNKKQRTSFRAHILNAIENTLKPVEVVANIDDESPELETDLEEEVTLDIEDEKSPEDKFIPVRNVDVEVPEEEVEEESFSAIEGMDETGRNFASNTFNKVEKQIIDAFESLASTEDRDMFYDYLLTNLKLYFDKFEDELKINLPEPKSPGYDSETSLEEINLEGELNQNI
jgi:hypothetical protein